MINRKIMALILGILIAFSFSCLKASTLGETELLDCDESCSKMFSKLKKYASNGSPKAQTLLALAYKSGEGVDVDNEQAWRWIRRAHRQAFPPALHIVSKWFRSGFHTDVNIEVADEFLQRAVDANFGPAILDSGVLNFQRNNPEVALKLIERAAKMGSTKAKAILDKPQVKKLFKIALRNKATTKVQATDISRNSDEDGEVLSIVASRMEPMFILSNVLLDIKGEQIYDTKGTLGSRLSDRKCVEGAQGSNMGCKVVWSRKDKNKSMH